MIAILPLQEEEREESKNGNNFCRHLLACRCPGWLLSMCPDLGHTTAGRGAAPALLPDGSDLTHWHRAVPRAAPPTQALNRPPPPSSASCQGKEQTPGARGCPSASKRGNLDDGKLYYKDDCHLNTKHFPPCALC